MKKSTDKTAIVLKRLQERAQEQKMILSLCASLSQALDVDELRNTVNGKLKEILQFDDFVLASSDEPETDYQIFYSYSNKNETTKRYSLNDGFFDRCMDVPDTVLFDLSIADQNTPDYFHTANTKGFKNGIGIFLPYIKGQRNVLFLFFKNAKTFGRESSRILRGIALQLSITIKNCTQAVVYQKNIAALELLKRNVSEKAKQNISLINEGFHGIIGTSKAMKKVYELISQVASSNATVLILGETGTGKELVASAIHSLSMVSNNRMIKVNCASIPENLIESELFGHEKGAFTGAVTQRIGKFEQAENSTIFLDEIGELPLELQGKLLRVLQEKEIERVGGNKSIKINVRIIAATNKMLEKEVAAERFRNDLYYRLNVFPIPLPALRDRKEDIEVLGDFFLRKHSEKIGKKIKGFSKKVRNSMTANVWPGNVRELENMVERGILFAKDETIREMTFPDIFITETNSNATSFYTKTLQEVEKEHILKVVEKCNGRISGPQGAAVLLGLPSTTLVSRMQKLGIKKDPFF